MKGTRWRQSLRKRCPTDSMYQSALYCTNPSDPDKRCWWPNLPTLLLLIFFHPYDFYRQPSLLTKADSVMRKALRIKDKQSSFQRRGFFYILGYSVEADCIILVLPKQPFLLASNVGFHVTLTSRLKMVHTGTLSFPEVWELCSKMRWKRLLYLHQLWFSDLCGCVAPSYSSETLAEPMIGLWEEGCGNSGIFEAAVCSHVWDISGPQIWTRNGKIKRMTQG